MKVFLTVNHHRTMPGYRCLVPKHPLQLEVEGIDKGELDILHVDQLLSFIPHREVEQAVAYYASFVKIGGKLVVQSPDFAALSRDFNNRVVSLDQINIITANRNLLTAQQISEAVGKVCKLLRTDHINHDFLISGERQ